MSTSACASAPSCLLLLTFLARIRFLSRLKVSGILKATNAKQDQFLIGSLKTPIGMYSKVRLNLPAYACVLIAPSHMHNLSFSVSCARQALLRGSDIRAITFDMPAKIMSKLLSPSERSDALE